MDITARIVNALYAALTTALIDDVPGDPAIAGVIHKGPLQGDPDPDQARISVVIHDNDPDAVKGIDGVTAMDSAWAHSNDLIEIGGGFPVHTTVRSFVVAARCLLEATGEDLDDAREIASTVLARIERTIKRMTWSGVASATEGVSSTAFNLNSESIQSGGPEAYDFLIKVRFQLRTTDEV